jgi:hypothetical protein
MQKYKGTKVFQQMPASRGPAALSHHHCAKTLPLAARRANSADAGSTIAQLFFALPAGRGSRTFSEATTVQRLTTAGRRRAEWL